MTTTKQDPQNIAHARLTKVLSREPWALPDPNRGSPALSITDLRKTMSEREVGAALGISRRQVRNRMEAEAEVNKIGASTFVEQAFAPIPRATAIQRIAEKACQPQGAKWVDYKVVVKDLYGFTQDGKRNWTTQQLHDLRKAVKNKYPTALFVPDWVDTNRAVSQRVAIVEAAINLSDQLTEALTRLAQEFPGSSHKALQFQMLDLLDYRNTITAQNWLVAHDELAAQLVRRVGDAGPVMVELGVPVVPDPILELLCA
jgi:hypothetical protein